MTTVTPDLDRLAVDTIRTLSIDGVQQANSGHPGAPMGAAPMAYVLWTRFLRHAPTKPDWPDRDRFVLSAGHASMLLYSLLHLTGYDVTLDELKSLPPVGQQDARAPRARPDARASRPRPVRSARASPTPSGMAIAERRLAAEFNRPGHVHRRPPDLRHRVRRRPPGGHRLRGGEPRRASPARQARRPLRRQPRSSSTGRPPWPSPRTSSSASTRTAGTPSGSRTATTSAPIEAAIERRAGRRPAEPDRGPDPHRLRQPEQAGQPEGARRAARARRGPPRQGGLRLGPGQVVLRPGRGRWRSSAPRSRTGERAGGRLGARGSMPTPPHIPSSPPSSAAGSRATCRPAGTPTSRLRDRVRGGDPEREPGRHPGAGRAVPELFGGAADLSESNLTDVKGEPDFSADDRRSQPPLRRPRARDGRRRQRHRLPRRVHPVRRARS